MLKIAMKLTFGRLAVTHFGSAPYRYKSVCHFDLPESSSNGTNTKYVALSLDDAPCRFADRDCSMIPRIQDLLAKYNNSKATFMLVGQWVRMKSHHSDLVRLLQNGHELANHGMQDRSYEFDNPVDSFGRAVDECNDIIRHLQRDAGLIERELGTTTPPTPWFRAPHGRYTKLMAEQLHQRNMTNVMCDTYASCPIVEDGPAIVQQRLQTVRNGSIILLHMPEVHVRQWCYEALELLLQGLTSQEHGYKVVTISELARLSKVKRNA